MTKASMMLITIIYHMMTWQWQHSFPQFPNCPQVPLPHQLILSHAMSIWMTLKGRSTALAKRLTDFSLMVTAMPLPMPLTPRYYTYCPTQCLQQHNQQSTSLLCTAVLILRCNWAQDLMQPMWGFPATQQQWYGQKMYSTSCGRWLPG